jgi:DNA-directed RNA polymerase subunit beta
MPVTILFKALGSTDEEILNFFYQAETFNLGTKGKITKGVIPSLLIGQKVTMDIKDPKSAEPIVKQDRKVTKFSMRKIEQAGIKEIPVLIQDMLGRYSSKDIVNPKTGEVILGVNQEFTEETYEKLLTAKVEKINLLFIDGINVNGAIRKHIDGG